MNRILLDTSAYSAFIRGKPEIKFALQKVDQIYVNPIIIGELLSGFQKGSHTEKNSRLFENFFNSPRVDILAINEETSKRYAIILNQLWKKGRPIPTNDIWIAATAMEHGLVIITTDVHYTAVSQVIVEQY